MAATVTYGGGAVATGTYCRSCAGAMGMGGAGATVTYGGTVATGRLFLFTAKVKLHEELARGNCMVKISEVGFKGLHKVHRRGKLIYPMYNY